MTVARAHHGFLIDLIREAQTRRDVVRVPVVLVAAAAVDADEHDAALQIGEPRYAVRERRACVGIEVVHPVVALRARHVEVVSKAQVEREPRIEPPVVLRVARPVEAVRRDVLPVLDQDVVGLPSAQEKRRESQTGRAAGRRGIRSLRLGGAKVERTGAPRLPHVHAQHATLEPRLQRVIAAHVREARGGRIAVERVVAVIVAAERHHAADAEPREHQAIDVGVD